MTDPRPIRASDDGDDPYIPYRPTPPPGNRWAGLATFVGVAALVSMMLMFALSRMRPPSAEGDRMPTITVGGWVNGPVDRDKFEGRAILIDAFATWCGPCRAQMPKLVDLHKKYGDRVQFLSLTSEGVPDRAKIEAFAEEYGIDWPVGYGAVAPLSRLKAETIPRYYLVRPDGEIVYDSSVAGSPPIDAALKEFAAENMRPYPTRMQGRKPEAGQATAK